MSFSLINSHVLTEEKDKEEKETFYDDLDRVYGGCPYMRVRMYMSKQGIYQKDLQQPR